MGIDVEMVAKKSYPTSTYDAHARTVPVDDYWGQVKRTVKGKPVSEEQVKLLVDGVVHGLRLSQDDVVLDLACGNGALSSRLLQYCNKIHGVDISPYLIDIAHREFSKAPLLTFEVSDVADYAERESEPLKYTKALIYAAIQYMPTETTRVLLRSLHNRFTHIKTMFIGNIPDRDLHTAYYTDRTPSQEELSDPEAGIGIWYSRHELEKLVSDYGWRLTFHSMPERYFTSHYRYDAILER